MTIQDFINQFRKQEKPEMATAETVAFVKNTTPVVKEISNTDWVLFGTNNLYPQDLNKLVSMSGTQAAIIKGKATMMAGSDILLTGTANKEESDTKLSTLPESVQKAYNNFIENPLGTESTQDISGKLSLDWQKYGAFAIEVVWSMDFTKIVKMEYVKVDSVRSGKYINGKINKFYISRDWTKYKTKGYEPKPIAIFDEENKSDYNQLIYVKAGTNEYYGEPLYFEVINWVDIEGQISQFHSANLANGYAPSLSIKFYQMPGSPEERKSIVKGIEKQYTGTAAAGRAMVFFSPGKDLAPDVDAIPVSNLDKQYLATSDLTVQSILTGNQITSPLLVGISVPGKLGGGTELETAYQIMNRSSIAPDRNRLARVYNKILKINGGPEIRIEEFKPFISNNQIKATK